MSSFVCPRSAAVVPTAEPFPSAWLRKAQGGDREACQRLLGWAYESACTYYGGKVGVEALLSRSDAEELAGMFVLEFEKAWPRIRSISRYTRRMLRNNLRRYLRRKRELRSRELTYAAHDIDDLAGRTPLVCEPHEFEQWNDDQRIQLDAVRETLARTDPLTRELMALRCSDPPLSYGVIAVRLNSTETALRMRATRFYRAVRRAHRTRLDGLRQRSPAQDRTNDHHVSGLRIRSDIHERKQSTEHTTD